MKVRVPLWGKPLGHATLETEATNGATVGVNLRRADGSIVTEDDLAPAASTGTLTALWRSISGIPSVISKLADIGGTASTGKVPTYQSDGTIAWDVGGSAGGYSEGTSFPGTPATDDKFYRTDRNLLYYYDGTRWLTVQEYILPLMLTDRLMPEASTNVSPLRAPVRTDYSIYLLQFVTSTFVLATNNGSNYWTVALRRFTAGNVGADVATFTTAADTVANWTEHRTAINAVLDSTARELQVTVTKTAGAPGSLFFPSYATFRLVG